MLLKNSIVMLVICTFSSISMAQSLPPMTTVEGADLLCVDPTDETALIYIDYDQGEENVWYASKGDNKGMEPPIAEIVRDPSGDLPFLVIRTVWADGANRLNLFYAANDAGEITLDLKFPDWGNTGRTYTCELLSN